MTDKITAVELIGHGDDEDELSCPATDTQPNLAGADTTTNSVPFEHSQSKSMKYYDLKKNWHRVRPHLGDKELNEILVRRHSLI